jgi:hypothetical protein
MVSANDLSVFRKWITAEISSSALIDAEMISPGQ